MDRRTLVRAGMAALAASQLPARCLAQAVAAPAPKLKVAAYSRHLQWLRGGEDVAQSCLEMALDGLDVTVQPAPGHVDPAQVRTALPAFVNAVRSQGVRVDAITCHDLEADSAQLEDILSAAAALGIKTWSRGTYRYDLAKPLGPQIEALKPGIVRLARLSEKHGVKLLYRNRAGAGVVGSAIFDLLEILRDCDPRHAGLLFDTGQAARAGGIDGWTLGLRAAGPYVGGVAFSDAILKMRLNTDEGGAFTGTPEELNNFRAASANRVNYGGGGQTNPWQALPVPLGSGLADLPQTAQILKDIHFDGPLEIVSEYPNGGAEAGADKITLPPAIVLGAMKRDLLTLKAIFGPAGLI